MVSDIVPAAAAAVADGWVAEIAKPSLEGLAADVLAHTPLSGSLLLLEGAASFFMPFATFPDREGAVLLGLGLGSASGDAFAAEDGDGCVWLLVALEAAATSLSAGGGLLLPAAGRGSPPKRRAAGPQ